MRRAAAVDHALEDRLGFRFRDHALLTLALTHISVQSNDRSRVASYQRLEFLGDRVLGLVVSAMLYAEFPKATEGELSRRLASLVRRETCADVSAEWDVAPLIRVGESEKTAGERGKPAILADVCEAIIGAVFIDGGYAAAEALVQSFWGKRMRQPERALRDAKTALQEWAQGLGKPAPIYEEVSRSGPAHAPVFVVSVAVDGMKGVEGQGPSKRVAEQSAAEAFLDREGLMAQGAVSR